MENEIWKKLDVDGLRYEYEISSFGRLKRLDRVSKFDPKRIVCGSMIQPRKSDKGYYRFCLLGKHGKRKHFYAHRLVAYAFIDNPKNKETVNHINGIKTDNRVENLEWCTIAENNEHGFLNGLLKRGRNIKPYVSIRKEWSGFKPVLDTQTGIFYKTNELADVLGLSVKSVRKMLAGKRKSNGRYVYS